MTLPLHLGKKHFNQQFTSTPIKNNKDDVPKETPKDRAAKLSQFLSSKLDKIVTSISTIELSLKSFVDKMSYLKAVCDSLVPNIRNAIPDIIANNQKLITATQQIEGLERPK